MSVNNSIFKTDNEVKSPRAAYGETLVELGIQNKDIVVLDADLSCSTQTCMFAKKFPERFFNIKKASLKSAGFNKHTLSRITIVSAPITIAG